MEVRGIRCGKSRPKTDYRPCPLNTVHFSTLALNGKEPHKPNYLAMPPVSLVTAPSKLYVKTFVSKNCTNEKIKCSSSYSQGTGEAKRSIFRRIAHAPLRGRKIWLRGRDSIFGPLDCKSNPPIEIRQSLQTSQLSWGLSHSESFGMPHSATGKRIKAMFTHKRSHRIHRMRPSMSDRKRVFAHGSVL